MLAFQKSSKLIYNSEMKQRYLLSFILVLSFIIKPMYAAIPEVLQSYDVETFSTEYASTPLANLKNKSIELNLTNPGLLNVKMRTGSSDNNIFSNIIKNIELNILDSNGTALASEQKYNFSSVTNKTNSINLLFTRSVPAKTFYLVINSPEDSLFDSNLQATFTISNNSSNDELQYDFENFENLGDLNEINTINTQETFDSPGTYGRLYKFSLSKSSLINIQPDSGYDLYTSIFSESKELLDMFNSRQASSDSYNNNKQYFLEEGNYFIRTFYSDTSNNNPTYTLNLSIDSARKRQGRMELSLTKTNGSTLDFTVPVYSNDSVKNPGNVFTNFTYERFNGIQGSFPFRFHLQNQSKFCKKKKNKTQSTCSSGPNFQSFKTNHFKSVIPSFTNIQVKNKKITGDIQFEYQNIGAGSKVLDNNPTAGELESGRFIIKFKK